MIRCLFTFAVSGLVSITAGTALSALHRQYPDPELTLHMAFFMTFAGAVVGVVYGTLLELINRLHSFRLRRRVFLYGNLVISIAGMVIATELLRRTGNAISGPFFWIVYSFAVISVTLASAQQVNSTSTRPAPFQFRIRSMLVATACVAGLLALVLAVVQNRRERYALLEPIESLGGEIGTSPEGDYVTMRRHITDSDLATLSEHLKRFPRLYHIYIYGKVSDRGLAHLSELTQLREVVLSNNLISDTGIKQLVTLVNLEELHLGHTNVTDDGAEMLQQLSHLRLLYLDGTRISDAAIIHLQELRELEMLSLTDTNLSDQAVNRLRKELPDTYINF